MKIARSWDENDENDIRSSITSSVLGLPNLLEVLLASTPVGVALFDLKFQFICVNESMASLNGYAPAQHLGLPISELMPEVVGRILPRLREVVRHQEPITDIELTLEKGIHQTNPRSLIASFYPILGRSEEIVAIAAMMTDITDRKRTERILRENEERLRLSLQVGNIGSWDFNFATNESFWCDRFRAIFGEPRNTTITPETFPSYISPLDRDRVLALVRRAEDPERGGDYQSEYRIHRGHKSENERWIFAQGKVLFDEERRPTRFIGTAVDVTERRKSEESRRKLATELARSNESLKAFAHIASHDLREPIRNVSSYLKLLQEKLAGRLDSETSAFIQFSLDGCKRMKDLIEEILNFAEAGQGRRLHETDCSLVLQEALHALRLLIKETGTVVTHDPMPVLHGDESQIMQIFQNLIQNAIKYREPSRPLTIHVGAQERQGEWLFSVSDNGLGIHRDKLQYIFLPMRRLHSAKKISGSGLGLSIAKKNVERHRGRIWVVSEQGKGSTFYFTISTELANESEV